MSGEYEIYAIHYGHHDRPAHENFASGDPHDDGPMPLDYFVWAIVSGGRTFVLDTGFGPDMAAKRGRKLVRPVADGLKAIGVDPATVSDVIISHMHYDHAGNIPLFPGARFHIQDAEMEFVTGRCMCDAGTRAFFEADHAAHMVHRLFEGRVQFHDGESELAPGITLHHVGGHTKGLQVVRVNTQRGHVVLASDAAHLYANMEREDPFPIFHDRNDYLAAFTTIRKLATSEAHIIPGHDPLVLARYPAAKSGLAGVVRLDADPKG
ncbi:MAG TPA: N-acyl homoserine lactonase family protein [Rhizomicrobium sp.]|nr:N-acyl homoserine lactonase family protein [Rhizomicrobium sp.]